MFKDSYFGALRDGRGGEKEIWSKLQRNLDSMEARGRGMRAIYRACAATGGNAH